MGSRGAFEDVTLGHFNFKDGGQTYQTIGEIDGVQILVKTTGSVKAPEYSHTPNRIYATIQNGALKHVSYYDEHHKQSISIDLMHPHHGLIPHKHIYLDHSDKGIPLTSEEQDLVKKIKRRYNLK